MFVEIAFGLETLVLIHMSGNAFLRSYQLLNSPSVATYILRDQFFNLLPSVKVKRGVLRNRFRNTFYVMALNEFFMDIFMYKFLWFPLKKIGTHLSFLSSKIGIVISTVSLITCSVIFQKWNPFTRDEYEYLPIVFATIGLMLVLNAFTIRKNPFVAWFMLALNHFWIALAVSHNETFNQWEIIYYLSGVFPASIAGLVILYILSRREKFDLNDYYGHGTSYKWLAFGFLISCLALMGFPVSLTFLGEDLMISHIRENQIMLMTIVAVDIMMVGISTIRIYTRVFMGPDHRWNITQANRFS